MKTGTINASTKHIAEIKGEIKTIECSAVAKEVLHWLTNNVENYIDNTTKYYKIDLVLDNEDLPETRKAQDLYRECGNIYDHIMNLSDPSLIEKSKNKLAILEECRIMLDEVTKNAFSSIKQNVDGVNALFSRMVFFYEKIIPNPEAKKRANEIDTELKALVEEKTKAETIEEKSEIQKKIVKKIDEGVALVRFTELEGALDITKFEYEAFSLNVSLSKKAEEKDAKKEVIKDYNIPEGFTIWLEISHRPKMKRPVNMF